MHNFVGLGRAHVERYFVKTNNAVFLNIRRTRTEVHFDIVIKSVINALSILAVYFVFVSVVALFTNLQDLTALKKCVIFHNEFYFVLNNVSTFIFPKIVIPQYQKCVKNRMYCFQTILI